MTGRVPLRGALKTMLEAEALTGRELAELQRLQQRTARPRWPASARWFTAALGGVAAALLVLVVSLALPTEPATGIQQRIAHEVLTNHLRIKPFDVETDSMARVQAYFDRLDFMPRLSPHVGNEKLALAGGRYCTLQGAIAAQLRFRLPSGEIMTYYQAVYDPGRFGALPDAGRGESPILVKERGFRMRLWQESGLVMVTAQQDG